MIMQIIEMKANVSDFCKNYSGNGDGSVMGVPITFLDKYNLEQFENSYQ